ncbi:MULTISPECIES: hypothetical protein [unclassified Streptomyces]|uniref:hypothetical protein n=1 Tax=unclassified Streptomyces TaxID=2593676 RepID=UPI001F04C41C|nr:MULTISPECIES: hypothetical protein [unclassified Streptomyces]MCH0565834.1 hypothetical protein [Streptomyces sp. MUM 2J]MCH0571361.1 hypothetical protein [Streptomyces sp. MUM 136J]
MGTKTVDEAAGTPAGETRADETGTGGETTAGTPDGGAPADEADRTGQAADGPGATEEGTGRTPDRDEDDEDDEDGPEGTDAGQGPSGVGQGAGAVVSAALGVVSLTGGWIGTVASARESLLGQLQTSSSSDIAKMIKEGYGDAWHATALWGGLFALLALITGVVVLARPAFGAPGRPQAPWIKSVAWAGVALGIIGLLLAVLKYTDVLLGLPSA